MTEYTLFSNLKGWTIHEQHKDMVSRLSKPGKVFSQCNQLDQHLLHMAIGISGEVGELVLLQLERGTMDHKKFRKELVLELGDTCFYLEGVKQAVKQYYKQDYNYIRKMRRLFPTITNSLYGAIRFEACYTQVQRRKRMLEILTILASEILNLAKGITVYREEDRWEKLPAYLAAFTFHMDEFLNNEDITEQEVLYGNMKKLSVRYPDFHYTNERAIQRKDMEKDDD